MTCHVLTTNRNSGVSALAAVLLFLLKLVVGLTFLNFIQLPMQLHFHCCARLGRGLERLSFESQPALSSSVLGCFME